jgi:hypothetical protein
VMGTVTNFSTMGVQLGLEPAAVNESASIHCGILAKMTEFSVASTNQPHGLQQPQGIVQSTRRSSRNRPPFTTVRLQISSGTLPVIDVPSRCKQSVKSNNVQVSLFIF